MSTFRLVFLGLLIACEGEATHEECVATPTLECEDTRGCELIRARPLSRQGDAFCLPAAALAENVGCMGASMSCDDAITVAEDPDGDRWWFWNTCLPEDFAALDKSDAEPCI